MQKSHYVQPQLKELPLWLEEMLCASVYKGHDAGGSMDLEIDDEFDPWED